MKRLFSLAAIVAIMAAGLLNKPGGLPGLAGALSAEIRLGQSAQIAQAALPAINVDAGNVTGSVSPNFYGTNLTPYLGTGMPSDPNYLAKAIPQKYNVVRVPGGSESDTYQWWTALSFLGEPNGRVSPHTDDYAKFANAVGGKLQISVNYGSGTPLEAANWVEYANGLAPTSGTSGWAVNSYAGNQAAPKGYFAWLRAQRGHPEPYAVKYWEIGNEIYGGWETDNYTNHDGVGYANRYLQFYDAMKAVDPSIKVGAILDGGDWWSGGWNEKVISTLAQNGPSKVDFVIVHWYNYWDHSHGTDGAEVQRFLDAADYPRRFGDQIVKPLLAKYLPTRAAQIEMALTEFGPNSNWPDAWEGYQIWSNLWTLLVLAESEQGNYAITNYWNFAQGDTPYSLVDSAYQVGPIYWAFDLMTHFGRGGDSLVATSSENAQLKTYASRLKDGSLSLLVVNKNATDLAANLNLANFAPRGDGVLWQYDQSEAGVNNTGRTAQMQTPPAQQPLSGITANFSHTFPGYSASVFVLPVQGGTWTPPTPNPTAPPVPAPTTPPAPAPTAPPAPTAISFAIKGSANPASAKQGSVVTLNVTMRAAAAANVLVDLEVYDQGGTKVFQKYYENQSFAACETKSYSTSYTTTASGNFLIKAGAFSGDWSKLYSWLDPTASFAVSVAGNGPAVPAKRLYFPLIFTSSPAGPVGPACAPN